MTPAVSAPVQPSVALQLALSLDVVVDEPTARECADLLRELREISLGDVWQSGEYRVERDDLTGVDTVRFLRGSHVRGEWSCTSANKLAAALRAIHAELVGTGITTGWLREGLLCEAVDDDASLEQESDDCPSEPCYNGVDCGFRQEALVVIPLRIAVSGFDDDEVTLGDGTINVIQDGSPFKVSASRSFMRDPRLSRLNPAQASRVARRMAGQGLSMLSAPASYKWCSLHDTAARPDVRLLIENPIEYWEQRGFVSRTRFGADPRNRDGLKSICHDCESRHRRMLRAKEREELGLPVRSYNRRTTARPISSQPYAA